MGSTAWANKKEYMKLGEKYGEIWEELVRELEVFMLKYTKKYIKISI